MRSASSSSTAMRASFATRFTVSMVTDIFFSGGNQGAS
jgi:hypothetical protein